MDGAMITLNIKCKGEGSREFTRRNADQDRGKLVSWLLLVVLLFTSAIAAAAQTTVSPATVRTSEFDNEVLGFLTKEMSAHLSDIKSYDPAPDRVFSALTTREYT